MSTCGVRSTDWTSIVPAALTLPVPGVYGVTVACHVYHAGAALKTSVMLSVALTSFAPSDARPGVPAGTSGGGRQIVIVLFAIDESGIVSGTSSTNAGTCSVWPAAERFRTQ